MNPSLSTLLQRYLQFRGYLVLQIQWAAPHLGGCGQASRSSLQPLPDYKGQSRCMVHVEFYKNKKNLIVAFKSPTHNTRLFFSKTMSVFTFFLIQNPSFFFFLLCSHQIPSPTQQHITLTLYATFSSRLWISRCDWFLPWLVDWCLLVIMLSFYFHVMASLIQWVSIWYRPSVILHT